MFLASATAPGEEIQCHDPCSLSLPLVELSSQRHLPKPLAKGNSFRTCSRSTADHVDWNESESTVHSSRTLCFYCFHKFMSSPNTWSMYYTPWKCKVAPWKTIFLYKQGVFNFHARSRESIINSSSSHASPFSGACWRASHESFNTPRSLCASSWASLKTLPEQQGTVQSCRNRYDFSSVWACVLSDTCANMNHHEHRPLAFLLCPSSCWAVLTVNCPLAAALLQQPVLHKVPSLRTQCCEEQTKRQVSISEKS